MVNDDDVEEAIGGECGHWKKEDDGHDGHLLDGHGLLLRSLHENYA